MLKKFEVKGFKSFNYSLIIDFADIRQYTFNSDCIKNDLLKTIIVYGKNSVGKTNLGLALFDIVNHLVDKNVTPGLYDFYINNDGKFKSVNFKYTFQFEKDLVEYSYEKDSVDNILSESLSINSLVYFTYNNNGDKKDFVPLELSKVLPNLNFDYNIASISSLRFIVNNSNLDKSHPIIKMYDFVSSMLWFRSLDEHRFIGYKDKIKKANDYFDFIFESDNLQQFQKLLNTAGIDKKLIMKKTPEQKKELYFEGKPLNPFFKTASNGIKALYAYFYWSRNNDISFLFIDEFDAYYHYELSELIVKDLEKRDFQTVLTSHNTSLLSNSIMRPDCYFVLTPSSITPISRATDRELREGHNLEKLYISGEFDVKEHK